MTEVVIICSTNQWTGLYMITASVMKEFSLQHGVCYYLIFSFKSVDCWWVRESYIHFFSLCPTFIFTTFSSCSFLFSKAASYLTTNKPETNNHFDYFCWKVPQDSTNIPLEVNTFILWWNILFLMEVKNFKRIRPTTHRVSWTLEITLSRMVLHKMLFLSPNYRCSSSGNFRFVRFLVKPLSKFVFLQ